MSLSTPNSIDIGTLKWVRKELDASLKRSRDALEAHVRDGSESGASLMPCVTALHEVQGVLGMLELRHASALAREMEKVATALAGNAVENREAGFETLMRGILQLPSYLDRLSSGLADSPEALAPLVNELRGVRGAPAKKLAEAQQGPEFPAHKRDSSLPSSEVVARKARGPYQAALLKTLRNDKPRAQLSVMRKVAIALQRASEANKAYGFWWLFSALIETLEDGSTALDKDAKKRLGQVDREIKRLAQGDESGWLANYPQALSEDIKQAVLGSSASGNLAGAVKTHFANSPDVAHAEEVAALEESLSGVNNQLLETVAAAVREDLATVKDGLDLFKRSPDQDVGELQRLLDPLRKVGDTLAMLGLEVPRAIVQEKYAVIRGIIDGKIHPTDRGVMELASALLYVESALFAMASDDDPGPLGNEVLRNLQRVKAGEEEEGAAEYSPMEAALPVSEYRQIVNAVIQESSTDISKAKDAIVTFLDNQADRSPLHEVPDLFMHVRGGLQMLEMERAALCIEAIAYFIGTELVGNQKVMDETEADALADSISAIEYFMEALADNRRGRDNILAVAEQGLAGLGLDLDKPGGFRAPAQPERPVLEPSVPEPYVDDKQTEEVEAPSIEHAPKDKASAVEQETAADDLSSRVETVEADVGLPPLLQGEALLAAAEETDSSKGSALEDSLGLPDIDDHDQGTPESPLAGISVDIEDAGEFDDSGQLDASTSGIEVGVPDEPDSIFAEELGFPDELGEPAAADEHLDLPELESGEGTPFDETVVLSSPRVRHTPEASPEVFSAADETSPTSDTIAASEENEASVEIASPETEVWEQPAESPLDDLGLSLEAIQAQPELPDDIQLRDIDLPDDIDIAEPADAVLETPRQPVEAETDGHLQGERLAGSDGESFDLDEALNELEMAELDDTAETTDVSQAGQAEIDGLHAELAAMVEQIEVEGGEQLQSSAPESLSDAVDEPVEAELPPQASTEPELETLSPEDGLTVGEPDLPEGQVREAMGQSDAAGASANDLSVDSLSAHHSEDSDQSAIALQPGDLGMEVGTNDSEGSEGFSVEEVDWDDDSAEIERDDSTIDLSSELAADILIAESIEAESPLRQELDNQAAAIPDATDESPGFDLSLDEPLGQSQSEVASGMEKGEAIDGQKPALSTPALSSDDELDLDADDLFDLPASDATESSTIGAGIDTDALGQSAEIDLSGQEDSNDQAALTDGDEVESSSALGLNEPDENTISFGGDEDVSGIDLSWSPDEASASSGARGDTQDKEPPQAASSLESPAQEDMETLETSEEVDVIEAGALDDILDDLGATTASEDDESLEIASEPSAAPLASLFDDEALDAQEPIDEEKWLEERLTTDAEIASRGLLDEPASPAPQAEPEDAASGDDSLDFEFGAEDSAGDEQSLDSVDHEFDDLESLTGDGLAAISDWLDDNEAPPVMEVTDSFESESSIEPELEVPASRDSEEIAKDIPDYIREPVAKDADQEILEIFIEEAEEELDSVRELLPRWKADHADANSRSSIRRSFHTLKGSGRLAGARLLGEYAWSVEHILNMFIDEQISAVDDVFAVLDDAVGTVIPHLIGHLTGNEAQTLDVQPYIARAEAVSRGEPLSIVAGADVVGDAVQSDADDSGDLANEPAFEPRMDPVLYEIFSKETSGYVETVRDFADQALIRGDTRINEGLVRALHTLQGSAHMAGVVEIADLSGTLDGYIKALYKNGRKLERDDLDLLVEASDVIDQIQHDLNRPGVDLPDIGPMLEMIAQRYAARMPEKIEVQRPDLAAIAAKMPGENTGGNALGAEPELDQSAASTSAAEVPASEGLAEPTEISGEQSSILASDPELLEIFLQEAEEILDAAEVSLDYWNKHRDERGVVAELQRGLHTLKGGARMAGIQSIAELSHGLETLFSAVVEETVTTSDHTLEVIQASFDKLVTMLESIRAGREPKAEAGLVEVLDKARAGEVVSVTSVAEDKASVTKTVPESVSAPAIEAPSLTPEPGSDERTEAAAPPTSADSKIEVPSASASAPALAGAEPSVPASEAAATRADAVRVDVDLLGGLVNLAGEVSIYRSRLEQKLGTFQFNLGELDQTVSRLKDQLRHLDIETEAQILSRFDRDTDERADDFDPLEFDRFSQLQQLSRGLMESITDVLNLKHVLDEETRETETLLVQQARVNTNLQEGLMRTRMVPFAGLVPRLRRILRQTSRELGKRAELEVTGGEGELDRSVLERITAPLEHMVRNAVFHGIETPEVREASGKSPIGKLTISLSRRGPEMIIRVTDDGQGIDMAAVRSKATERGLIDSGMEISDHDLQQVIMEPGFTTAKKVTQISGRGVGMDVVYSELKQLGGSLEIDSTENGTSFTMYLPFTLAVNRALLARVADEVYAVPLAALDGVVRLGRQDLERVYSAETPLYQYGGETYLVQYLGAMVGSSLPDLPDKGETLPVLLIRAGDQRVALQVDGLMGSREIVVKPLGPQLAKVPGVAGATILGDGRVVLILEVSTLLRREVSPQYQRLRRMAEKRKTGQGAAPVKVMVVDDSITMRKVATRLLERQGMEVTTAKDGVDALARLHETVPDVMLLDIEMPRMDGYELAGRMRRDPRFEAVPIIMITSRTGSKHRDRATELGVNRYLGKPYQEADLLHHIRELATEAQANQ